MSGQKQCVTCSKSGGILTCNGCEQAFCGKHVIEHRQELANQLDGIMQEHDLLQQEFVRSSDEHFLLQEINKWEKESITKIQVAAEAARADLQQILDRSKEQLSKECHDIAVNLRSSREADDFSEIDLSRWVQQLKELKLETKSSSSIQLIEDERSVIHLITIRSKNTTIDKNFTKHKTDSFLKQPSDSITEERFAKVIGSVNLSEERLVAVCTGSCSPEGAKVSGQQRYSQGRQTVRFKIEQSKTPYDIFLGCISSQAIESKIRLNSPFVIGWFGYNEVYQHGSIHGNCQVHGYNSDEIVTNDVLQLTFDCDKKQIGLFHERTKKEHVLPVNVDKAPLPWQLLLVLRRVNDCIRILS